MQESGRCGRNGDQSKAVLLYNSITIRTADIDMKENFSISINFPCIEHIYDTCDGQSDDEDSDEQEIANWEQIIEDPSFLSLLDETEWHIDSFSFQDSISIEPSSYPNAVETAIDTI
ncbi:Hypothetical predicted protein [Paramuricea clavata]|uniref:Uncharacterized protein n=1 Tax=Paramuricea clavata TaxID=317549 RepID=A0A6S7GMG7_PARCT|nr:Hypothetical predicted protein [Paramuricea clavata]